jgi:hypothetical protein
VRGALAVQLVVGRGVAPATEEHEVPLDPEPRYHPAIRAVRHVHVHAQARLRAIARNRDRFRHDDPALLAAHEDGAIPLHDDAVIGEAHELECPGDEVAELHRASADEVGDGRLRMEEPDQSGPPLVVVVVKACRQPLLLDGDDVVDRSGRTRGGAIRAFDSLDGGTGALEPRSSGAFVLDEPRVVRLRPPAHDREECVACRPDIPGADAPARVELDGD